MMAGEMVKQANLLTRPTNCFCYMGLEGKNKSRRSRVNSEKCLTVPEELSVGSHAETLERERGIGEVTNACQGEEVPLTQNEMAG